MTLYLLLAVPITLFLTGVLYFRKDVQNKRNLLFILYGFLISIPCFILHKTVSTDPVGTFSYGALLVYSLLNHFLIYYVMGIFTFHLVFGFSEKRKKLFRTASPEFQITSYLGGYYLATGVLEAVLFFNDYSVFVLFYQPTVWIILLISSPVAISLAVHETGVRKIAGYISFLFVPFIGSLVFPLFYRMEFLPAIIITVLLTGGAGYLFQRTMSRSVSSRAPADDKVVLQPRV